LRARERKLSASRPNRASAGQMISMSIVSTSLSTDEYSMG
jgi:hypothetical protein